MAKTMAAISCAAVTTVWLCKTSVRRSVRFGLAEVQLVLPAGRIEVGELPCGRGAGAEQGRPQPQLVRARSRPTEMDPNLPELQPLQNVRGPALLADRHADPATPVGQALDDLSREMPRNPHHTMTADAPAGGQGMDEERRDAIQAIANASLPASATYSPTWR